MKRYVTLVTSLLLIPICLESAQSVYIIIHGTWCKPFQWHMPGGTFYEVLRATARNYDATVTFLQWSGGNSHTARIEGAQQLVNLIKTYNPDDEINIVAHSHGGNVAFLASQLLSHGHYRIHRIFTLGTPIYPPSYLPNMQIIRKCYNIFSFGDMIQMVGGIFDRELPPLKNIWNIRLLINGTHPNHIPLHNTLLASLIPQTDSWDGLESQCDYLLECETGKKPVFKKDTDRKQYQEDKKELIALYNDALRRLTALRKQGIIA